MGLHITQAFLNAGHEVLALTRRQSLPISSKNLRVIQGSLEDLSVWVNDLQDVDVLVHNAVIWGDESSDIELLDLRASVSLFSHAAKAGVGQVIYTSSSAVLRPLTLNMDESKLLTPDSMYGATKAATEAYISVYASQFKTRWTIMRPTMVVGVPLERGGSLVINDRFREIVNRLASGDEYTCDPAECRYFTPVRELAQLYVQSLSQQTQIECYLAVSHSPTYWTDVVNWTKEALGQNYKPQNEPKRPPDFTFDISKLTSNFGTLLEVEVDIKDLLRYLISLSR